MLCALDNPHVGATFAIQYAFATITLYIIIPRNFGAITELTAALFFQYFRAIFRAIFINVK